MGSDICAICSGEKKDHHRFKPIKMPEGCICSVESWLGGDTEAFNIPLVCDEYAGDGENYCDTCEHEKECHKK